MQIGKSAAEVLDAEWREERAMAWVEAAAYGVAIFLTGLIVGMVFGVTLVAWGAA